ncbi:biotin--[acetyl-CoA-carboxylase] ligase [Erythrobacter sp. YT30]|uniref:biotin--[acetyl-CoA-carboxylase] ligase n=1 Tax=Erythrobacter sp. YT30 TaxID=1735012 RepID=UPI0009E704EC|nr:biotin--[acetyl-CoA-carboxylase] ligase [Erythrobacter sp. YT30]
MSHSPCIEVVEETGSTNADLLERLNAGEIIPDGYWLRAERQTGGRGRLGRKWESPKGNLFCSTVVNLREGDPSPSTLSLVTGLAVFDAIRPCLMNDTPMLLKWPNDVMVFGDKIAGILLERAAHSVIVGIGINVSYAPELPDRKTISIAYANGKFANGPDSVLDGLAQKFAQRLSDWREKPLSETLLEWTVRSHRFDDRLRITGSDGEQIHAWYRGIDEHGALRIQPLGARETTVHAGDVTLKWHDEE